MVDLSFYCVFRDQLGIISGHPTNFVTGAGGRVLPGFVLNPDGRTNSNMGTADPLAPRCTPEYPSATLLILLDFLQPGHANLDTIRTFGSQRRPRLDTREV